MSRWSQADIALSPWIYGLPIKYRAGGTDISAMVDAYYTADHIDCKSMSRHVVRIGYVTVACGFKKQSAAALSTCRVEYYPMAMVTQELLWVQRVAKDAGLTMHGATLMTSDSQSAIALATGEKPLSSRVKNIDIRVHLFRGLIGDGTLDVKYVPTEEDATDM